MKEECGIYGIYSSKISNLQEDCIKGLELLQHRGQEGCGIGYFLS